MILVVGGFAAGKKDYLQKELGYSAGDMADAVKNDKPVLYNLQDLVWGQPTIADDESWLAWLLQKEVVVCNEVGGGIVPLDAKERAWRDAVGRLCAQLADKAAQVVRVVAGLPLILKES